MNRLSFLGVPFYSRAEYAGMGKSTEALRKIGIVDLLKAKCDAFTDLGDVPLPPLLNDSGPKNLRNFDYVSACSKAVADSAAKINKDDTVFCLGGECVLIMGILAGLRATFPGEPGLLWLDAHGDFNTPETSPSGFVGGMCLALACGRGPSIPGVKPSVKEKHVVHFGSRDLDPEESQSLKNSPVKLITSKDIRDRGLEESLNEAVKELTRTDWILCHLDIDVIDPTSIQAVNFPSKGGLTLDQVKKIVRSLEDTRRLKGFDLAGYNPLLDPEEESGRRLIRLVSEIFS